MEITNGGRLIAGGNSLSNISGEKTETSRGTDYWIIKPDSTYKIEWDKTVGGNDIDILTALQQTRFIPASILKKNPIQ